MKLVKGLTAVVFTVMMIPGICTAEIKGRITIFHAGSLKGPFAEMEKHFEVAHPGVDIVLEGGGSTKMARMISEEGKAADIMASADYAVIDKSLIPGYASVNIRFAANQLVLCYTEKSRYAGEINADNWIEILAKKDVSWGHSDPNLDPCGYRSLMVLQLAEKHYNKPGLYDKLIAGRPQANVLPKADQLVASLKNGQMDYAWEYLSVAVQKGLQYVVLDDRINLGNYKHDDFYKQAGVKVTGKDPGTWIIRTGQSITYGVTLIKNAANPDAAAVFLDYLLDPAGGLEILKSMGQPPFIPAFVPTQEMKELLPQSLQKRVDVKK